MKKINSIPVYRNTKANKIMLSSLFQPASSTTFSSVQTSKSFEDISRNIWDEMQLNTASVGQPANPCESEPFSDEFYTDGIDFMKLVSYLKMNGLAIFDYRTFQGAVSYSSSGSDPFTGVQSSNVYEVIDNIPYEYVDSNGNTQKVTLTGKLNKRICYLEQASYGLQHGWWFTLDPKNKVCIGGLEYYYKNTFALRQDASYTPEKDDYYLNNKYKAVVITSAVIDDYIAVVSELGNKNSNVAIKKPIIDKFAQCLKTCTDINQLKFLYDSMPEFVVDYLNKNNDVPANTLWEHVVKLTEYDDTGLLSIFKDASAALIKVLRVLGNAKLLYEKFSADQKFVKAIYKSLDGSSEINGQKVSNRIIFSNLVYALCMVNDTKNLTVIDKMFTVGGNYKLDGNVTGVNEGNDEFFLQQLIEVPPGGMDVMPEKFWEDVPAIEGDKGAMYKPLDMVMFTDISGKEQLSLLVPAIFVKALSDEAEWDNISQNIRIGFDVLAVIAGIVTVATTGNPLVFALSMADIGLAVTDITVQAFRKEIEEMEGGKEFLETWEKIYLVGTLITAGPALINSCLKFGTTLLRAAELVKNFKVKDFIVACFTRIVFERNIANFTGNTVKKIIFSNEALSGWPVAVNFAAATRLQDSGVLFIKGLGTNNEIVRIAAIYKGEAIAAGTAKEVRNALKEIWSAKGAALIEKLEAILNRRRIIIVEDISRLGEASKTGAWVSFKLIDEFGNAMGEIIRANEKAYKLVYRLIQDGVKIDLKSSVTLFDETTITEDIKHAINKGEHLLYADFNLPLKISEKMSGLGRLMLNDALAFFKQSPKFGKVDGTIELWTTQKIYADYGGSSILLQQFWKAKNAGLSNEKAAFETFSGKWAKENGFGKIRIKDINKDIEEDEVILNFLKSK
ncbi:hypothetical protein [Ferruginibacter profundus]